MELVINLQFALDLNIDVAAAGKCKRP